MNAVDSRRAVTSLIRVAALLFLGMVAACATDAPTLPREPASPPLATALSLPGADGVPYLGLVIDDDRQGVRVSRVLPGPARMSGIATGDILRDRDGSVLDVATLRARVSVTRPGDRLALTCVRAGEPASCVMTVADRGVWRGPAALARRHPPAPALAAPAWSFEGVTEAAALPALAPSGRALERMLVDVASSAHGYNRSAWADGALADGATLAAWPDVVRAGLARARRSPRPWQAVFCTWLLPACHAALPPPTDLGALAGRLEDISLAAEDVFAGLAGGRQRLLRETAAWLAQLVVPTAATDAPALLRVMRASTALDSARMLVLFGELEASARVAGALAGALADSGPARTGAVDGIEGRIVASVTTARGTVVVGGPGPNVYHMDGLLAVIDSGGDDRYVWAGLPPAAQLVVDLAGDDRYEGRVGGPGAGILGVALLRDFAGNDRYTAALAGCGSGIHGFGVLDDRGGRDSYACGAWSQGAGVYGGGVLRDAKGGDRYEAPALAQGIGGPGGFGLLLDSAGNDVYRADGVVPSAYATPGVFFGMSQGVGYGQRPFDHGGLGLLLDEAGDDRYFAGEFAQGGGYYGGLGLLDDAAGDDFYVGHRYAQGFAVHQAAGALVDRGGDDQYWATTAAAQGAAWDQARALLVDLAGDDSYRAATLSQGAASQQARALLFDRAGDDDYRAEDRSQGAAGPNGYHFDAGQPVCSLGLLIDGDGTDSYSSGLGNGTVRLVEGAAEDDGAGAGHSGLAIDGRPSRAALAGLPAARCRGER